MVSCAGRERERERERENGGRWWLARLLFIFSVSNEGTCNIPHSRRPVAFISPPILTLSLSPPESYSERILRSPARVVYFQPSLERGIEGGTPSHDGGSLRLPRGGGGGGGERRPRRRRSREGEVVVPLVGPESHAAPPPDPRELLLPRSRPPKPRRPRGGALRAVGRDPRRERRHTLRLRGGDTIGVGTELVGDVPPPLHRRRHGRIPPPRGGGAPPRAAGGTGGRRCRRRGGAGADDHAVVGRWRRGRRPGGRGGGWRGGGRAAAAGSRRRSPRGGTLRAMPARDDAHEDAREGAGGTPRQPVEGPSRHALVRHRTPGPGRQILVLPGLLRDSLYLRE